MQIILPVSILTCSHHWHTSLHQHTKFRVKRKDRRRRSYGVILIFDTAAADVANHGINFRFHFSHADVVRRSESLNAPNFIIHNDITSHGWVITILPVWENGRPPYWNSTSGYDFNLQTDIGISFCIGTPNLMWIGPSRRSYDVSKIFKYRPLTSRINFQFQFDSDVVLRRSGSLSAPNFANISCQISRRSVIPLPKYRGLSIFKTAAVRHLEF